MLGFLMASLNLSLVPVVAPELQQEFGLSAQQVGLLMSGFLAAYGLAQIPTGVLASTRSGALLAAAFACMACGCLLFAGSSSFSGFLIGRAIQGVGAGMVLPAAGAVIATRVPRDHMNRAWGIFGVGWGGGATAAFLLLPALAAGKGFRWVLVAVAVATAIAGLVAAWCGAMGRPTPTQAAPPDTRPAWRAVGEVARRLDINLLGLVNAMSLAVGVGALSWTPAFLREAHGASVQMAAYLTTGLGAAQIVAPPVGAALAGRFGHARVILATFAGLLGLSIAMPFLPGTGSVFVAGLLIGFCFMARFPPLFALVSKVVSPSRVGLANGYVNALSFVGSVGSPWLLGLVLDRGGGFTSAYLTLAGFAALGAAAILGFRARVTGVSRVVTIEGGRE